MNLLLGAPLLDLALAVPFLLARDLLSRVLFGTPDNGALVSLAIGLIISATSGTASEAVQRSVLVRVTGDAGVEGWGNVDQLSKKVP